MRSAYFWDFTQRTAVVYYRSFGTNYSSQLQESSSLNSTKQHSIHTTDRVEIFEAYGTYRRSRKL